MQLPEATLVGLILAVSTLAAIVAVLVSRFLAGLGRAATPLPSVWGALDAPRKYVFRDGYLVSDLDEDEYFVTDPDNRAGAWDELVEALSPLDLSIGPALAALRDRAEGFVLVGHLGPDAISVAGTVSGDETVVTIGAVNGGRSKQAIDRASIDGLQAELETLRQALDASPTVMWRETADRQIYWANAAYLRLAERSAEVDGPVVWPLRQVFGEQVEVLPEPGTRRRCSVQLPGASAPSWFEVSAQPGPGGGHLFTGQPIDRLVTAEEALRNFVQTLSKTFAHLPIGLAIFDRKRELMLFNPALVTLSALDPEWLSSRPSLFSFLDQLRENQRMPEPRDYRAWRASIAELEQAAQSGSYQDLWTLPTGQTYRVIGRPHPDGAVAFMFEDISSEVSLTRQFRADLDLFQAVIDETEAAIAVFGNDGQLVRSNAGYADLWGTDPREQLGTVSLAEATRQWERATRPAPIWGEIRDFATPCADRAGWTETLTLADGVVLECRVAPVKGGATLVSFRRLGEVIPAAAAGAPAAVPGAG